MSDDQQVLINKVSKQNYESFCNKVCASIDNDERIKKSITSRDFFSYYPIVCPKTLEIKLFTHKEIVKIIGIKEYTDIYNTYDLKTVYENLLRLLRMKESCELLISDFKKENSNINPNKMLARIETKIIKIKEYLIKCTLR